jgi:hypothetical protein
MFVPILSACCCASLEVGRYSINKYMTQNLAKVGASATGTVIEKKLGRATS